MARREKPAHCMLRIEGFGESGRYEDLSDDEYTVGRGYREGTPHVHFTFPHDRSLSRLQFRLLRTGGTYEIVNESEWGTHVNGRLLKRSRKLKHGDRITAGAESAFEFLLVTATNRAGLLGLEVPLKSLEYGEEAPAEEKKPLYKRPVMLGIVGFYVLLGFVILAAGGSKKEKVKDPGKGPYMERWLTTPLQRRGPKPPAEPPAAAMEAARKTWESALSEHGGSFAGLGPHDYLLLQAALQVLRATGAASGKAALDGGDAFQAEVARMAAKLVGELDLRLMKLHEQGRQYIEWRHMDRAKQVYEEILDLVPGREEPIRRFALDQVQRLTGKRRR